MNDRRCINVGSKGSCCSCIFDLHGLLSETNDRDAETLENHLKYYLACEEIAAWLDEKRLLEMSLDAGDLQANSIDEKFKDCVWVMPRNKNRQSTKMVNLLWERTSDETEVPSIGIGGWKDHAWNLPDERCTPMYHATMCLPTLLLVWQMVVGGITWNVKDNPSVMTWLARDYKTVLTTEGKNAVLKRKQKMRQRMFYARIPDFMAAKKMHTRLERNDV